MTDAIKVLHISDSRSDQDAVLDTLEKKRDCFVVTMAESLEQALQRLYEATYDIALTDIDVPGLDGLEAIDLIRSNSPETPIIVVTQKGSEEIAAQAFRKGVDDYVKNTYDQIQMLPKTIESVLSGKRSNQDLATEGEAKRMSRERLNLALEVANLGLWDWNLNTDRVFYDERWGGMLGYSSDEIEPNLSAWARLVHPDDKDRVLEVVNNHFKGLTDQFKAEQRIRAKSGEWRWILALGKVIDENKDGSPARILGIHLDITESKRSEEILKNQVVLTESLLEAIPTPVYYKGSDHRYLGCNKAFAELNGMSKDEIIGSTVFDLIDREGAEISHAQDLNLLTNPGSEIVERSVVSGRGAERELMVHKATFMDAAGAPAGLIGVLVDITDRKKTELALAESERKYRLLADNSLEVIWQMDLDLSFTYVNRPVTELTGYTQEEWIGTRLPDHCDEKNFRKMTQIIAQELEKGLEGTGVIFEAELLNKNKESIPVEIHGRVTYDDHGRPEALQGTTIDISLRKKAEQDLERSAVQWRETFDAVNDVIWLLDTDNRILRANKATEKFFGVQPLKIVGKHCWEVAHGVQEQIPECPLYQDGLTDDRKKTELLIDDQWVEVTIDPMFDSKGLKVGAAHLISDIDDRKKAEEALVDSRKSFKSIVEKSADGILVINSEGTILYANSSAERLLGQDQNSLIDNPFGAPSFGEESISMDVLRPDGEMRAVEMRATDVEWFGQTTQAVMLHDMTERKRHERELRKEKRQTEQYLNDAGVMFVAIDRTGKVVRVNRRTCEVLGRQTNEIEGKDWFGVALPEEIHEEVKGIFNHLISGSLDSYEYVEAPVITKTGEKRMVSWHNTLLEDKNGEVFAVAGFGADITDRKEMERKVLESEKRYRVLFERSNDAIYIADKAGNIITANPATARLFGVSSPELLGANITNFYWNPRDRAGLLNEVAAIGYVNDFKLEMKDSSQNKRLCLVNCSKWEDDEGNLIGYLTMCKDITESVKLEDQLRQAQKMESIGTLAGGIAHDFNNLLTVVAGYSEMLIAEKTEEDPDLPDLSSIKNAADKAAELVKQLLTFSRKVETNPKPINLNQKVQESTKLLSRTIPKMITIRLRLKDNLSRIYADPGQIEQVIINLAVNAKDAMPEGGTLTFSTENVVLSEEYCKGHPGANPGDYVCLTIEDTGHGMPKDVVLRIFEPFYTTKHIGEGTGLGLAMVYGIVKQHSGYITCNSEPGEGAAFKIYFPIIQDEISESEGAGNYVPVGGNETILLVDDEDMIRNLGVRLLERAGYKVLAARTGEEALEIYKQQGAIIGLVIMDMIMPGMGGRQALIELKRMDPNAIIIIASGYSPEGLENKATDTGASGFVGKPFNSAILLDTVRSLLDK